MEHRTCQTEGCPKRLSSRVNSDFCGECQKVEKNGGVIVRGDYHILHCTDCQAATLLIRVSTNPIKQYCPTCLRTNHAGEHPKAEEILAAAIEDIKAANAEEEAEDNEE